MQSLVRGDATLFGFARILVLGLGWWSLTPGVAGSDACSVIPVRLRCEAAEQPLGVDRPDPRLGWKLQGEKRGARASGYRVLVASRPEGLARDEGDLWDSGHVTSQETVNLRYAGAPLQSSQTVHWKVRVWDEGGNASRWSEPASFTMGILTADEWQARWIRHRDPETPSLAGAQWIWHREPEWQPRGDGTVELRSPQAPAGITRTFRRSFELRPERPVRRAWLAVAIDNGGEVWLNEQRVLAVPQWEQAVQCDPTPWLRAGVNVVVIRAVNGGTTPNPAGVLFALKIELDRGPGIELLSDPQWESLATTEGESWRRGDGEGWAPVLKVAAHGAEPWTGGGRVDAAPSLPLLRKSFTTPRPVQRALLHVTGLGHYELFLDGQKVGDRFLDPAWSVYEKTVYYATYDVTAHLQQSGDHVFGVMLGKGFFNTVGDRRVHGVHADRPLQLRFQAHLTYADGQEETVVSDPSWKTRAGPITHSAMLGGEDYDARQLPRGWDRPGFDASRWTAAVESPGPGGTLRASLALPMTAHEVFRPVRIDEPEPGVFVYDFGQNAAAVPRLRVRGRTGQTFRLTPAEQRHGMSPRRNDGRGRVNPAGVGHPNYFSYTLGSNTAEEWMPQFTYTGFQFLEVQGAVPAGRPNPDRLPVLENLESVHVRNRAPAVGSFACSHPLLNATDRIIDWAVRANLAHVLTDCPHREKLGWLEVAYLMGPSIAGRYDVARFYAKVSRDCGDSQDAQGRVPTVAPSYPAFSGGFAYTPEWGAAAVVVPWLVYEWYGDRDTLGEAFPTMARFVDYMRDTSRDLVPVPGLGDWYDYGHGKAVGASQFTPPELSAMATFHRCARLVAQAARVLERPDDARAYDELAGKIAVAFQRHFFNGEAEYRNHGSPQTAHSMALVTGLVPPDKQAAVRARILADLQQRQDQQTAGDIGFWYLIQALAQGGHSDALWRIVSRTNLGSYGFIVNNGWTSMPEAWDADTGASMNHCMLGHIQEWLLGWVAGIRPDPEAPGFQRCIIDPHPVGDLTWARGSLDSVRGAIVSDWRREGDRWELKLTLPPGMTATVRLPAAKADHIRESGRPLDQAPAVEWGQLQGDRAILRVASGQYHFVVSPLPRPDGAE